MKMPSKAVILFNAGGAALIMVGVAAVLQSVFSPESSEPCRTQYHTGTLLNVTDANGRAATPGALQGRFGQGEWGVADSLRVQPLGAASAEFVLRVALPKGSAGRPHAGDAYTGATTGGMGFRWQPGVLGDAASACLSYAIKLPKDFKFHRGGRLPGLFGGQVVEETITADTFAARFRWSRRGNGGIHVGDANGADGDGAVIGKTKFDLPRGRWVRFEQEINLNTPGKKDGVLKIWMDGELVLDRDNLIFRKTQQSRITGVVADTYYSGGDSSAGAPADTAILMTPFDLRWR